MFLHMLYSSSSIKNVHFTYSHDCGPCVCACTQGLGVVRGGVQQEGGDQLGAAGEGGLDARAAELLLASHMDLILQVRLNAALIRPLLLGAAVEGVLNA